MVVNYHVGGGWWVLELNLGPLHESLTISFVSNSKEYGLARRLSE